MISSLIISALIVVPQVLVVLMAPWAGRSGTKPGPPPASAYRVRRFADQRAVFRFDLRSAASIIVGVQVLDGISATVLGVLTALVTADITAGTGRFKPRHRWNSIRNWRFHQHDAVGSRGRKAWSQRGLSCTAATTLLATMVVLFLMPETRPQTEQSGGPGQAMRARTQQMTR